MYIILHSKFSKEYKNSLYLSRRSTVEHYVYACECMHRSARVCVVCVRVCCAGVCACVQIYLTSASNVPVYYVDSAVRVRSCAGVQLCVPKKKKISSVIMFHIS